MGKIIAEKSVKKRGRPFEKGNDGGPGRPPTPAAVKRMRKFTQMQLDDVGAVILEGNRAELKRIVADKDSSVLKVWVAKIALRALYTGDMELLNAVLDRFVGKVKDRMEVTGVTAATQVNVNIPSNGREAKVIEQ